ncbi:AAA family ATPase [Paenibacillus sp. LHD-117]|uniref:AAA family ATPase n=1 Tax=Paenibacillus sp. LHD-117 TaxID=3071412 RepID=UPI0027DF3FC5|nr:AAA family ATPase [Paenibacillus sp. LHD-117]MDQ6418187.1 AAA family ATPase [Paenibacillus sp. LHD-117]
MRKYTMEIGIGVTVVLLVFLQTAGYNVLPFVILAAIAGALYYTSRGKGKLTAFTSGGGRKEVKRESFTFDQIGGQERAKQELVEALDFLVKREQIEKLGIRPLKGILLAGPPGTGKTLLAKAAAHYTDSIYLAASGSEFVEMYVGVGAGRIRDLFKEARTKAKKAGKSSAVIFIDEIEVIGGKRDGGQHREYDQTLNQLLTEMDGIHANESPRILLIAATNRKEMLDGALLRPGRFDRHIGVELPDKKGRLHILRIHANNKPIDAAVDLADIAEQTYSFSGAQLESVMNEAAIYALRENAALIQPAHLNMAIDKVMLGEKTDKETSQEERKRVALHELGHAIMAELIRPGSVSQVALSPRGGALGYVRHQPQQDQYLYTTKFLHGQIMITLGGAAAEEMFYGERSTGSRGDFDQAVSIVRTLVESGLTELGIIDSSMMTPDKWSAITKDILDSLMAKTKEMLEMRRGVFEHALQTLLQEENVNGDAFRTLLNSYDAA